MPRPARPIWLRYGAAVVVTGAALGLKLLLVPLVTRDVPGLLFFAAVMVSALFGGMGPGLLAIALGAVFDGYFFMPPFGRFQLNSADQLLRLGLFVIEGIFISLICARLIAAKKYAEDSENTSRDLQKRILEISDAEQRRIGHDLHDGLGQHLTGISLMTRRLQKRLSESSSPDAEDATKLSELAKTAVEWTHDLCRSLSPPALESSGLPQALEELAANVENVFHTECSFEQMGEHTGDAHAVDLNIGVHLYRIAQEAISNAIRHGDAKHVRMQLDGNTLRIIDDGKGIEQSQPSPDGMGLRIMRYRARMIGASIDVRDKEGGGTIVTCRWASATNGNTR